MSGLKEMNELDEAMDQAGQQHGVATNILVEVLKDHDIYAREISEYWRPLLALLTRFDLDKGFPKPD